MLYHNENDPFAAEWLGNLWPEARVDARDIREVQADDLTGFERCHFFAGVGGWEYALQLAGWPAIPVWTGSCPCQPFSAAGKQKGEADERHLWPEFRRLIAQCRPPVVFGEQVASRLGREWLAGVRADLEALGYAVGAADLCAASQGAPHIRQRLYWVASGLDDTESRRVLRSDGPNGLLQQPLQSGSHGGLAHTECNSGRPGWATSESSESTGAQSPRAHAEPRRCGDPNGLADTECRTTEHRRYNLAGTSSGVESKARQWQRVWPNPWASGQLIPCLDGKTRRVEPSVFPLAHGIPARVGRLRAYGNAIVPQVAATFVRAFLDG